MSYAIGEAAIEKIVRGLTGFGAYNTRRGDWKPLNSGKAPVYVILRSAGWTRQYITICTLEVTHTTVVEVWRRYKNDGETYTDLAADVNTVITGLEPKRLLDDAAGVIDASVERAAEPIDMWKRGGGPLWLRWDLAVVWKEHIDITFTD